MTELERLRTENERLTQAIALIRDTLRRRTISHGRLVATRLQCPQCKTMEPL